MMLNATITKLALRRCTVLGLPRPAVVPALATTTTTTTTIRRGYRGDSGEATHHLSPSEEALLEKGKPIYDEILARHVRPVQLHDLPRPAVQDLRRDHPDAATTEQLELEIRRKRLIYRSKQRGWLEVDVLLGTWASEFVPTLTNNDDELDQFEDFVNMETIDIYNVITLRLDVPEPMKRPDGQGVVERIQEWARSSPLGKADPSQYRKVKASAKLI